MQITFLKPQNMTCANAGEKGKTMTECKNCQFCYPWAGRLHCGKQNGVVVPQEHSCDLIIERNIVQIRVAKIPEDVFPKYCPELGKVYKAEYVPGRKHSDGDPTGNSAFCIVDIKDKRIILRKGEFEIVGGTEDGKAD